MICRTYHRLNKGERNRQFCFCNNKRKLQEIQDAIAHADAMMYICSGLSADSIPSGTVTAVCRQWYDPACTQLPINAGQSGYNLLLHVLDVTNTRHY